MKQPLLALVISSVLAAAASNAIATEGCECPNERPFHVPSTYPGPVPTNVRFFYVSWTGFFELRKGSATGDVVPVRVEETGQGPVWIVPVAPLEPHTVYHLGEVSFTTGDGPDVTAPSFNAISTSPRSLSGACGDHYANSFTLSQFSDDTAALEATILEVELTSGGVTDTRYFPGKGALLYDAVGLGECSNIDGPAGPYDVSVTAIDWAGNRSAVVGPVRVKLTFFESSGHGSAIGPCAVGGRGASPALPLLAALLVLGWRRRVS